MAMGPVHVVRAARDMVPNWSIPENEILNEVGRLHEAVDGVCEELERRRALVAEALEAFDDGSYGSCVTCEVPIPFARLKALPETPVCMTCQENRE